MKKTAKRSPRTEIERLRARLEDAEQTLDAIRSGKVDALIVSSPEGERVFTLHGADHRYRRIVEGMLEGALVVSADGRVLYANRAFAELVATPLDRVLGSRLESYVPAAGSETLARLMRAAEDGTVTYETNLVASDGRVVQVLVSGSTDGDGGGDNGGIALIVTDLTTAMRGAEQRFEFLTEMLPQIIWSARPDGWLDYFNRRWFEFTGLSLAEAEGSGWESVIHPEDLQRSRETWIQAVATGEPYEISYRFKRGWDGAYRWHLGRALPQRDADGTILRWYGTCTDIEDERALSADAQRARLRAEEATRLKDEFLATLSHELRTPLNAILGWGRMLQSGGLPDAQRRRAYDTIVRNGGAQNQLIEDLLDVSRIVSGNLRLNVAPVAVSQVIEAALEVVRPAADAKHVTLASDLDVEAGLLLGDSGRLQQVVWNLLANAVKFTPRGGRVEITLRNSGSSTEIAIADTGKGITNEFLPYVFDRFRQQDGGITRRAGGLGLGLAIVKNIVELHGGTVEAHSDGDERGSKFVVRLPVTPVAASVLRSTRPSSVPPRPDTGPTRTPILAGLRVLVVDDETDARDLLKCVVERCDATVTAAASSEEALKKIAKMRPDVIVSDIGMPDEDGYTFIRKLRALPSERGGATPAIALTAYARTQDRTRALMAGFQSHLTKPVDPEELLVVIANLAGRFS